MIKFISSTFDTNWSLSVDQRSMIIQLVMMNQFPRGAKIEVDLFPVQGNQLDRFSLNIV